MGRVAAAGRTIAWITDEVVYDAVEHPDVRVDDPSVEASRGRVRFRTPGPRDGEAALHLAVVAAHHGLRISRPALDEVAAGTTPELRWTPTMRALLVSLLAAGRSAIPVVEALDHVGIWTTLLPEWTPARSRPQHNPYHGFTVDRHLLETVAVAATLPCHRPDLLLLGALLHDLGKAYPGDHSDAGAELAGPLLGRIGLTPDEAETVQLLVRHHLLLPDTATRRDLDDPATLDRVAAIVQRGDRLDLLASLAVADGRATGPTAWSDWKAKLVAELVRRVHVVLAGSTPGDVVSGTPFTAATLEHARAAPGEVVVRGAGETLVVSAPDQPGLFSRITGAVALHGLDIRSARITCVEGTAVDELEVSSPFGEIRWERVEGDVRRAVTGRLAITARLAERAQAYPRRHLAHTLPPEVRIIDGTDPQSAIVEVVGPDSPGLLYRLSRAFAELGLDITRAMASTVGHDVVDAFYVHDPGAFGLADEASRNELRLALRHALTAAEA